MSIYCSYKGAFLFADEQTAQAAREKLLSADSTVFYTTRKDRSRLAVCIENKLVIDSKGFAGGETPYDTESLLNELAGQATKGRIKVVYEAYGKDVFYIVAAGERR